MKTYFVRHGVDWQISTDLRADFYNNAILAIHFEPKCSIVPEDYASRSRPAIRTFSELARDGGYVCATYPPHPGCLIGKVLPGSEVKYRNERSIERGNQPAHDMVLKCLQLTSVRILRADEAHRLLVLQPRLLTLCRWRSIGDRIEKWVDVGVTCPTKLHHLLPVEHEVICAEFLRSELAVKLCGIRLAHFTTPTGRTQRDVDIVGIDAVGNKIFAQVTYGDRSRIRDKEDALKAYSGPQTKLVMFCRCSNATETDGIQYVPIETAIEQTLKEFPLLRMALGVVPVHIS